VRVIVIAKPNTLWAGAESLNQIVGRKMETSFESRPMDRPAPDRHLGGKAQPEHRPRNFVSLTYLNGCQAKTTVDKRCVGLRSGDCYENGDQT
jgi:hypothetical protein